MIREVEGDKCRVRSHETAALLVSVMVRAQKDVEGSAEVLGEGEDS